VFVDPVHQFFPSSGNREEADIPGGVIQTGNALVFAEVDGQNVG
jgi:hypothetical protein